MSDGPAMPASPYRGHVFGCTADFAGGCAPKGGPAIAKALQRELRDRGIRSAFAVTTTGCVGGCKRGANVVVHPDGTWYGGVTPEMDPGAAPSPALAALRGCWPAPAASTPRPAPSTRPAWSTRSAQAPVTDCAGPVRFLLDPAERHHY